MSKSRPDPTTLTLFTGAVVIGGANFVAVRISNRELDPFWGAGLRFTLAALLFLGICLAQRLPWPRGRELGLLAVYGLLTFSLTYAFMYWALVTVSASVGAVVLAAVPLVTVLLAAAQGLERLRIRSLIGAVIALAGILWKTIDPDALAIPLAGLVAMILATATAAQGVIVSKRVSGHHPATVNALGMAFGVPALFALSLISGESWVLPTTPEVRWSLVYLSTVGSVGLFICILMVVRRWTASATSYAFVMFPLVTMLLEAWVDDVPLTVRGVTGALVVMAGVWFGAFTRRQTADDGVSG